MKIPVLYQSNSLKLFSVNKLGALCAPTLLGLSLATLYSPAALSATHRVNTDTEINTSWYKAQGQDKNSDQSLKTNQSNKNNPINNSTNVPNNNAGTNYILGNGYNTKKAEFVDPTTVHVMTDLNQPSAELGNTEAFFTFGVDLGRQSILEHISGSLNADVTYASVDVNGNAALAIEHAADAYTGTYTLFARVKPKKSVMLDSVSGLNNGLQPTDAITDFFTPQSANVVDYIGDEFIHAIEYGSWVMISLRFDYRNAEDKINIGGQFAVNWQGGITAEAGADYAQIENANSVNVTFTARQYGGDATQLSQVVDPDLPSCALNNPTACFNTFNNAIDYLQDVYPGQFVDNNGDIDLSLFKPIHYITAPYATSGPELQQYTDDPLDHLSFASKQALRKAHDYWERALVDIRRAEHINTKRSNEISVEQKVAVDLILANANHNADKLADLITNCVNGSANQCETDWAQQTFLRSYQRTALKL